MSYGYETVFGDVPEGKEGEAKKETKGPSKVRHQRNKVIAYHLKLSDKGSTFSRLGQEVISCIFIQFVTSLLTVTARDPYEIAKPSPPGMFTTSFEAILYSR